MASLGEELLAYMQKWGGSTGILILAKESKKLGITDINDISEAKRWELMNALVGDFLSTFLEYRRFTVARSELVSIFGFHEESYKIHDRNYKKPKNPPMFGRIEPGA